MTPKSPQRPQRPTFPTSPPINRASALPAGLAIVKVLMVPIDGCLQPTFESFFHLCKACPDLVERIQTGNPLLSQQELEKRVMQVFTKIIKHQFLTGQEQVGDVFYADLGCIDMEAVDLGQRRYRGFPAPSLLPPPPLQVVASVFV